MPEATKVISQPRATSRVEPSHSVPFSKSFSLFRKSNHSFLCLAQQRVHYEARDRDFLWNIFHRLTISWKFAGGSEMHSWTTTPCIEALISEAGSQSQRRLNHTTFCRESGRKKQRRAKGKQKQWLNREISG